MYHVHNITEKPRDLELFLETPQEQTIAMLSEAFNKSWSLKLGGINEINFQLPLTVIQNHDLLENKHIDMIKHRHYVSIKIGSFEEKYLIKTLNRVSDGENDYLSVNAQLSAIELADKIIKTYSVESYNATQLLNDGLSTSIWSVGEVDTELDDMYRSFDITNATALSFISEVANKFGGILEFDTEFRKVHLRAPENIGVNLGLRIAYAQYLETIDYEENSGDIATLLRVTGSNGISIEGVTANGQPYIEDFSYYLYPFKRDENKNVIDSSHYMSDDLCNAILDYSELLEGKDIEFSEFKQLKIVNQETLANLEVELSELQTEYDIIQDSIDIANAAGDSTTSLVTQRNNKQHEIDSKQIEIDSVQNEIDSINSQITTLQHEISIEQNFTEDQIIERSKFVNEKLWENTSITNDDDLLEEAKKILEEMNTPSVNISLSIVNFKQIVTEQKNWNKLHLGELITIVHDKLNLNIEARITEIDYDFENISINITVSNVRNVLNEEEQWYKDLKNSIDNSTTVDLSKYKWDKSIENENAIQQLYNDAIDATKRKITGGVNQSVEMTKRGLIIKDIEDPASYLIAQNGVLAITNNNGEDWDNAITKDGIIAERIIGELGQFVKVNASQVLVSDSQTIGDYVDEQIQHSDDYTDEQITEMNNSLYDLEEDVGKFSDDGFITFAESENLKISLNQVKSESTDFINVASSLNITTEKTNYEAELSSLELEINNWINQLLYPIAVTSDNRNNITQKFENVQIAKSKLINKIASVREKNANDYTDENGGFPFGNWQYSDTTLIDGGQIKTGTIEAESIKAGELIGFTIKSKPSSEANRVEITNNEIKVIADNEKKYVTLESEGNSALTFYEENNAGEETRVLNLYAGYHPTMGELSTIFSYGDLSLFSNNQVYVDGVTVPTDANGDMKMYCGGTFDVSSTEADIAGYDGVQMIGDTNILGDLTVRFWGHKSSSALTSLGEVYLYAYETPEYFFGDMGVSTVVNGKCVIDIEPLFLETVNTDFEYHVFLSPYGEGNIYVAERNKDNFVIKGDDMKFSYEIKAKRKGFEDVRLEITGDF
ncbi:phage tail spike protein [Bacillus sp. SCS-151]|uniref:phage tail spike protein n=1 Tax=Nanhaiella sioensis TaxID=3115293 RepID=UPI0039789226